MAEKGGSRRRLRDYFLSRIGKVLSSRELQRASGGAAEFASRIRELRDEEGFRILTHRDRDDLRPGQYLLETEARRPAFARTISKETRVFVLDRNGYTCQMCGRAAGDRDEAGRPIRLHIGHIVDKSQGGTDDAANLRALCSACNEGASNLTAPRPDLLKLMTVIRRAKRDDRIKALEWLLRKFPDYQPGLQGGDGQD